MIFPVCNASRQLALLLGLTTLIAPSGLLAQDTRSDVTTPLKLDTYVVTGSHISRLEGEGPQPIATYNETSIADSGAVTLGDYLSTLPFNSGTEGSILNPNGFGTAYARGATTLNPRGLGAQRFLVLINGRRATNFGAPDSTGASVFDVNSIPVEAIEGIDYLKDGASAIYGSDAITGVMNIKLKKSYNGLTADVMVGDVLQPGGQGGDPLARAANLLAGASTSHSSVMVALSWFKQGDNTIQDYNRSQTTDFLSLGVRGADDSTQSTFPFNIFLTAAQSSAAGYSTGAGYYVVTGGQPTSNPGTSSFSYIGTNKAGITDANRYNYAPTSQLVPGQENWNLLVEGTHDFNASVSGFGQLLNSDDTTRFLYTPNTINSTSITTDNASSLVPGTQYLVIPANNPYNPFKSAIGGTSSSSSSFLGRALFGPTRKYDVESQAFTLLGGLDGKLDHDWTWTGAASYGSNLVATNAYNNIRAADLQAALNGTLAGYTGSYLNPFGQSSNQAMVNSLFVTSNSTAKDKAYDADLSASGPLLSLEGLTGLKVSGNAALALGGEWRHEELDNNADTTNYIVNPTSGSTPFKGSRTVTSEFIELDLPVLGKFLDLQLAGRYDKYNDFGGTSNPKFAVSTEVLPWLKLRASYSQSFKAPDLGQLYLSPITTYSSTSTLDPLNPGVAAQPYPQLQGGNPNLKPEKGKVWYEGTVIDLDRYVKGLSLTVDHFSFEIDNVITTFTNTTQLFTLFPRLVVRGGPTAQAPNGPIQFFNFIPINAAAYYWRGVDLSLHEAFPKTTLGSFTLDASATRITYFAYNAGTGAGPVNKAGLYNNPRWTGTVQAGWHRGSYGASLEEIYKGPYLNNANAAVWGENPISLFNATVSYNVVPWHTKFTIGCENLLNTAPPPNGYASPSDGIDVNTYGAWAVGRFATFKASKQF